ncbi:hypothetical protein Q3G72_015839 [Acer saccharum]|nr:hypothetical protein Q3G72_015839 [Acer saccharum]
MGTLIGWVSITKRNAYMHGDWAETEVDNLKAGGTDQEIRERLIAKLRGGSTNFEGKALEKKNPDKMFEIALLRV